MLFAISVAFLYLIINVVAFTNHAFLHCAVKSGWSHRRPHLPSKEGTVDNTHVNDYTGIINMGKEKKETRRECFEGDGESGGPGNAFRPISWYVVESASPTPRYAMRDEHTRT